MNRSLRLLVFLAGLAAVGWVGAGQVGTNPLALTVTALIGAFYALGALELQRFGRATATLAQAVADLTEPVPDLASWLARVHPSLRSVVRRRIAGEPAGLPGPGLAPYLAGLLVLLGMLGTFLGMVLTLRGTGLALENATDLQAVRASLAGPVQGLGLAFGTSVAGIATSAALGLQSALARRERAQAAQALDARIATTLRIHSVAHQREESLRLLQRQADAMPALVEGLRALMDSLERRSQAADARLLASQQASADSLLAGQQALADGLLAGQRASATDLLAGQQAFHERAQAMVEGLASAVDRSLKDSLGESARIAGATIRPVVEATMAGVAQETAALHAALADSVQRQLDGLAGRFEETGARVADTWQSALARHEHASHGLAEDLRASLAQAAGTLDERSAALMDGVARRQAGWQEHAAATMSAMASETAALHARIADAAAAQLTGVTSRLDDTAQRVTATWLAALERQDRTGEQLASTLRQALADAAAGFDGHAVALVDSASTAQAGLESATTALLESARQAQADLESAAAARDERRLAAMSASLAAMAASLRDEWQQAGAQAANRQERVCETMERTARDITAQAEAHARGTIAEIARLVQAASEAPRAAAEVVAELRVKLSDSMARDNTLLEERARILETLGTLLDGVNEAATGQRGAIDALVASSAALLDRVGARFGEQVDAQAGRLEAAAAHVAGGAIEVASLGEAFGFAVQQFSESNEELVTHLKRLDGALDKSLARSDEQLAYYVAQAREVVDLSVLSQRQILEDLQRLAGRTPAAAALAR